MSCRSTTNANCSTDDGVADRDHVTTAAAAMWTTEAIVDDSSGGGGVISQMDQGNNWTDFMSIAVAAPSASSATSGGGAGGFGAEVMIPLYSIIFVLSVVGNILVIVTLTQNRRMRTVTNVFLLNLVSGDIYLIIFNRLIDDGSTVTIGLSRLGRLVNDEPRQTSLRSPDQSGRHGNPVF